MWGKAIVVVLLAVLANFYLGGRTERPSDAAKADRTTAAPAARRPAPDTYWSVAVTWRLKR